MDLILGFPAFQRIAENILGGKAIPLVDGTREGLLFVVCSAERQSGECQWVNLSHGSSVMGRGGLLGGIDHHVVVDAFVHGDQACLPPSPL